MAKLKGQLFARLALDYFDHPKIMSLSAEAIVAHLEMIVYSRKYGTDGAIPMRFAMRFAPSVLDELASNDESSPSIIRNDDGTVEIYGYSDMQETSDQIAERRQKRREAGAAGANARWKKNANGNANRMADRMKIACESDGKKMAETETETETYISTSNDALFEDFWNAYPRKIAKKEAMKKFAKAVKDGADTNTIIAGAKTYAASVVGKEQKYVAHPTTWLNQGRWEDETEAPAPTMSNAEAADRLRNPWKYT